MTTLEDGLQAAIAMNGGLYLKPAPKPEGDPEYRTMGLFVVFDGQGLCGEARPSISGALTSYLKTQWDRHEADAKRSAAEAMEATRLANTVRELLLGDFAR